MSEPDSSATPADAPKTMRFEADVARLLDIVVHSVYSDREAFLRELVSNAADACEKLRFEAIVSPALAAPAAYSILVKIDKDAGQLNVIDNGIGMSRDNLERALGTIASSGTRAFLARLSEAGEAAKTPELIGQFGIGFYASFMVADRVVVETRRAGEDHAWTWTSAGKGEYDVAPLALDAAPEHGTRVILHLKEDAKDMLDAYRVERIVRDYSSAITIPIDVQDGAGEPERVGDGVALWSRPKADISKEDYTAFYHSAFGQFDDPALTIHWRAEGRTEFSALAFIPSSRPVDLFDPARRGRGRLYVRRVLVSPEADLLPSWLRFVRLVVDSSDVPLNVSREMVQNSPVLGAIRKAVAGRVLQELQKMAESDADGFAKVWDNFGAVLKEGLYEDPERRDALLALARFATSTHPKGGRTLKDYVADLRPNQTAIYTLQAPDAARAAASPHLEGFRARGIEVLMLTDAVDAFWTSTSVGFDGKPFRSVTQGDADITAIPLLDENAAEKPAGNEGATVILLARMKQVLENSVADVRPSHRLSDSVACLVSADAGYDRGLAKILSEAGRIDTRDKPILEVNPTHPLVEALAARGDAASEDALRLIFDMACIADGEPPSDPAAFSKRLTGVLAQSLGAAPSGAAV